MATLNIETTGQWLEVPQPEAGFVDVTPKGPEAEYVRAEELPAESFQGHVLPQHKTCVLDVKSGKLYVRGPVGYVIVVG